MTIWSGSSPGFPKLYNNEGHRDNEWACWRCCYGQICVPQNSYAAALALVWWCFLEVGPLGDNHGFMKSWGWMKPRSDGIGALRRRDSSRLSLILSAMWEHRENTAVYQPKREPHQKAILLTPWSRTYSCQNCEKVDFYRLKYFCLGRLRQMLWFLRHIPKAVWVGGRTCASLSMVFGQLA